MRRKPKVRYDEVNANLSWQVIDESHSCYVGFWSSRICKGGDYHRRALNLNLSSSIICRDVEVFGVRGKLNLNISSGRDSTFCGPTAALPVSLSRILCRQLKSFSDITVPPEAMRRCIYLFIYPCILGCAVVAFNLPNYDIR